MSRVHRLLGVAVLLVLGALASSSRTHLHAAGNGPTTYSAAFKTNVVFSVPIAGTGTVTLAPWTSGPNDIDGFGTLATAVATFTVADITNLAEAQWGQIIVECVPALTCSAGQQGPTGTGYPIPVRIFSITSTTGTAGVITAGVSGAYPVSMTGRAFASTLYRPFNGTTDAAGNMYVADAYNHRLAVFAPDGSAVRTVGRYGTPLALEFFPSLLAWYPSTSAQAGCFDLWNNLIPRGQCSDLPADKLGHFFLPTDVAVSPDGNTMVVADAGNYRLQILTRHDATLVCVNAQSHVCASDGTGWDIKAIGQFGLNGPVGQFSGVWGVALTSAGRIVATENDNDRVQIFDPASPGNVTANDGSSYQATTFGHHGDGNCPLGALNCTPPVPFEFNHPGDVTVDESTGRVIVADTDNNRVQIFDVSNLASIRNIAMLGRPDGVAGTGIPNDGIPDGWNGEEFSVPEGVATDADGRLYVAEFHGDRVQIFNRTPTGYEWAASFGRREAARVEILGPSGVAIAPAGVSAAVGAHWLWVIENDGFRLARLNPAQLTVTQTVVTPASFQVGDTASLSVKVRNTGAVAIAGVQLNLLSDFPFASAVPNPVVPPVNLAPGTEQQFDFSLSATSATAAWHLTAVATGNVDQTQITTSGAVPAIVINPKAQASVAAVLTAPNQATLNTDFTAQVQVRAGNVNLTNVRVTLTGTGVSATITPTTDTIASLAANTTVVSLFTVHGTALGTLTLTASVASNETEANSTSPTNSLPAAVTIAADTNAPSISAVAAGNAGDNGWFKRDAATGLPPVTVTFTASDPSGVSKIWYWSSSTNMTPSPIGTNIALVNGVAPLTASVTATVPDEGETLVAFWAEDTVGNPSTPAAGKPGPTESLVSFCSRLPAQCTKVKIDTLPPSLTRDTVVISPNHTQVSVHFAATDVHSTVRSVCLSVPAPTSPDCLSGPNAQIVFDAGSTTRGTLTLTSPLGIEVFGKVVVTDYAGYTSEFQLPFAADYAPTAVDDPSTLNYFTHTGMTIPAAIGVRVNDIDPFGHIETWNVTQTRGPRQGVGTLYPDGHFDYTPNAGYVGADDFLYKLTRPGSTVESNVAQVHISVVNVAPIATPDAYTVLKNSGVNAFAAAQGVLLGGTPDSDPDGDPMTASLLVGAQHGVVSLSPNGAFTYTPNPGFAGVDTFTYQALDGFQNSPSALTNVAVATIAVQNRPPVAVPDAYTTHKILTVPVGTGLRVNDTDPDDATNTLTTWIVTQPAHGSVTLNTDGSFTYTPTPATPLAPAFVGVDAFTYLDKDPDFAVAPPSNGTSAPATVSITITNTSPTAVDDTYPSIPKNVLSTISAANGVILHSPGTDTDPEGDTLSANLVSTTSHGVLVLNPDGSFTYTPAPGYIGPDSFTYSVTDGYAGSVSNIATVSLTVTNQPPVAVDDAYSTVGPLTVAVANGVRANDSDPDDPLTSLTVSLVSNVGHGTLTLLADGSFVYMPTLGFHGTDTFTYRLSDGIANSNIATVTITVGDAPPVAVNDNYTTHGTLSVPVATGVRANDSDPDDALSTLTVSLVAGPSTGTLVLNTNGAFTYTPPSGVVGTVTFTYSLSDGSATSNVATVTINVTNRPPVAMNDAMTVHGSAPVPLNVLANDSDPDGDALQLVSFTQPAHGVVTQGPNNTLIYTPAPGYSGLDIFTYTIKDTYGATATATVTITAIPNRPPVCSDAIAVPGSLWPPNHKFVPITITNVTDPDHDPLAIVVTSIFQDEPTNSYGDGNTPIDGQINGATALVRAERQGNKDGRVYHITFTANDGRGGSCSGEVTVCVPHDQGRFDDDHDRSHGKDFDDDHDRSHGKDFDDDDRGHKKPKKLVSCTDGGPLFNSLIATPRPKPDHDPRSCKDEGHTHGKADFDDWDRDHPKKDDGKKK